MSEIRKLAIRGCLALLVLLCALPVYGQSMPVSKGVMLIATDQVKGSIFQQSVVLITKHDDQGTVGVIVNRPGKMMLSRILPDHQQPEDDAVFYFGGPVQPMGVISLTQTKRTHPTMAAVIEDIYWVPGMRALAHIASVLKPDEKVRAYNGFSGWGKGQLDQELARGDWIVIPGKSEYIFADDVDGLWQRLIKMWSGKWI